MRTFIMLMFFTSISFGQTANIGSEKRAEPVAEGHCVYMDMGSLHYGQDNDLDTALRVSFFKYEIYYNIVVEELRFSGVENLDVEIVNVYLINDTEMKQAFRYDVDQAVSFDVWISWDAFVIDTYAGKFVVSFMGDGIFEFRLLPVDEVD